MFDKKKSVKAQQPKQSHDDETGMKAESTDDVRGDVEAGTYEVLSPLQYNGTRYEIGEPVELSAEDAAPLLPNIVKPWKK